MIRQPDTLQIYENSVDFLYLKNNQLEDLMENNEILRNKPKRKWAKPVWKLYQKTKRSWDGKIWRCQVYPVYSLHLIHFSAVLCGGRVGS